MNPRDTIAAILKVRDENVLPSEVDDNERDASADYILSALTAAGHTIVGPADMEKAVEAGRMAGDEAWKQWTGGRSALDGMECIVRAALTAAYPHMPVPDGWVLVPVDALKWLNGEGPDGNGHGFGDAPDDNGRGAFWWRKKFADMLAAAPKPAALTQEPKP